MTNLTLSIMTKGGTQLSFMFINREGKLIETPEQRQQLSILLLKVLNLPSMMFPGLMNWQTSDGCIQTYANNKGKVYLLLHRNTPTPWPTLHLPENSNIGFLMNVLNSGGKVYDSVPWVTQQASLPNCLILKDAGIKEKGGIQVKIDANLLEDLAHEYENSTPKPVIDQARRPGSALPSDLLCPISLDLMDDPVILTYLGQKKIPNPDNSTYDRKNLLDTYKSQTKVYNAAAHQLCYKDPLSNAPFEGEPIFIPNDKIIEERKRYEADPTNYIYPEVSWEEYPAITAQVQGYCSTTEEKHDVPPSQPQPQSQSQPQPSMLLQVFSALLQGFGLATTNPGPTIEPTNVEIIEEKFRAFAESVGATVDDFELHKSYWEQAILPKSVEHCLILKFNSKSHFEAYILRCESAEHPLKVYQKNYKGAATFTVLLNYIHTAKLVDCLPLAIDLQNYYRHFRAIKAAQQELLQDAVAQGGSSYSSPEAKEAQQEQLSQDAVAQASPLSNPPEAIDEAATIAVLISELEAAILAEDFQKCASLKAQIDLLKASPPEITLAVYTEQLTSELEAAILAEDYKKCADLKAQIDLLKTSRPENQLATYKKQLTALTSELSVAILEQNFQKCGNLKNQIDNIKAKIGEITGQPNTILANDDVEEKHSANDPISRIQQHAEGCGAILCRFTSNPDTPHQYQPQAVYRFYSPVDYGNYCAGQKDTENWQKKDNSLKFTNGTLLTASIAGVGVDSSELARAARLFNPDPSQSASQNFGAASHQNQLSIFSSNGSDNKHQQYQTSLASMSGLSGRELEEFIECRNLAKSLILVPKVTEQDLNMHGAYSVDLVCEYLEYKHGITRSEFEGQFKANKEMLASISSTV